MRLRFPGFGLALCAPLALLVNGCGGSAGFKLGSPDSTSPSSPGAPSSGDAEVMSAAAPQESPPAQAPGSLPPPASGGQVASAGYVAKSSAEAGSVETAQAREMLDIEARMLLKVQSVERSVAALHVLARRVGGVITTERVDTASEHGTAELTLRIPSTSTDGVFRDLAGLGDVLSQTVTARDVGKEYFDAGLRLSSLEATLHRYQEILAKANTVEEVLRIENELSRIRTEIEQVKGNLRWLADRVARATLHVSLRELAPPVVVVSSEPEPKFFPGLRVPMLVDFGSQDQQVYFGGGVSLRFSRSLSLDLDILKLGGSERRGPDALIVSLGGEIYSDLLGGGERRFLNPYLGWRAGYARFDVHDQAILGATLGLEVVKTRLFRLDLEARNYVGFLGERGAHYVLEPALAASIAF